MDDHDRSLLILEADEMLPAGQFRHSDHRFESSRPLFQDWANRVAGQYNYSVRFLPVGPEDESVGLLTQMGVFEQRTERKQVHDRLR